MSWCILSSADERLFNIIRIIRNIVIRMQDAASLLAINNCLTIWMAIINNDQQHETAHVMLVMQVVRCRSNLRATKHVASVDSLKTITRSMCWLSSKPEFWWTRMYSEPSFSSPPSAVSASYTIRASDSMATLTMYRHIRVTHFIIKSFQKKNYSC